MSQIDKLNYLPILFWFFLFLGFFYFFIFSFILPLVFGGLRVRNFFFFEFLFNVVNLNIFSFIIISTYLNNFIFENFLFFLRFNLLVCILFLNFGLVSYFFLRFLQDITLLLFLELLEVPEIE